MVVEPLLVVPVAAFYFAVVPGCLGTDRLVDNVKPAAKNIQRMNTICLLCVGKFSAVVRLDHVRRITEVDDRTLHKVYGAVAAVFPVCVYEPFKTTEKVPVLSGNSRK